MKVSRLRSLSFRMLALGALLAITMVVIALLNLRAVDRIQEQFAWMKVMAVGPERVYRIQYLADEIKGRAADQRTAMLAEIGELTRRLDQRYEALIAGDASEGIPADIDPALVNGVRARREVFRQKLRPALVALAESANTDAQIAQAIAVVETESVPFIAATQEGIDQARDVVAATVGQFKQLQYLSLLAFAVVFAVVAWLVLGTLRRIGLLSSAATRIAAGELSASAGIRGEDEIAGLGEAFDTMTSSLREKIESEAHGRKRVESLLVAITETVQQLATATAEIATATKEQATASQEQASSVFETLSAADEVSTASEQVAARARTVSESARSSEATGREGRGLLGGAIDTMSIAKQHADSVAASILALAEQSQAIGEIVSAINDIADQTNILAINAAIEAAHAGDQGRGFAVVAAEVKDLAEQARKATTQVRQLLGEIQKTANRAVLATEEGTRSVHTASQNAGHAGQSIATLVDTITQWAASATQIAAGAAQQVTGLGQITLGIKNISDATNQNLIATKQTEEAATQLAALGDRLQRLLDQRTPASQGRAG